MSRPACTRALAERTEQLDARRDVLEHVRQDRDVDRLLRLVAHGVGLYIRHKWMGEARSRELEHPWARIDRDDSCADPLGDVIRKLALAATDVEHALLRLDPLDEEVVVARQPMLCMDAFVVFDRAEVDPHVRILVDL